MTNYTCETCRWLNNEVGCTHDDARSRARLTKDCPYWQSQDSINHPLHYTSSGIETIDVIEAWGLNFHLGNTIKYISRAGKKGDRLEDLKKAKWYLDREIKRNDENNC